uniref:Helitron_like_N domain-containing protein n=1 Tax=Parastrongyloides trichosuri TaxID=131310 RepID=A0A0N4ZGE6_PARTI
MVYILTPPEFISAFVIYICHDPEFKAHNKIFEKHKHHMRQIFLQRYIYTNNIRVHDSIPILRAENHLLYEIMVRLSANGYNILKSNLPFDTINYGQIRDNDNNNIEDDLRLLENYLTIAKEEQN